MKKIITIGMCVALCLCASQAFGGIVSSNGSFEIQGAGGPADALDWDQTPGVNRTNSAAYAGSWSMSITGGIEEWANAKQYIPQDVQGMEVIATVWVMSPSNDSAVAWHPDWFGDCSVVFKLEKPDPDTGFIESETYAIKDVSAGGVRDTWMQITNRVTSMPAGMSNFKIVCLASMTGGLVYFDDVQVDVIPEPVAIGACLGLVFLLRKRIIS